MKLIRGTGATVLSGDEVVARGQLGALDPGASDLVITDEVPIRVERAGTTVLQRRTSGWWNGFAVTVSTQGGGGLSVSGTLDRDAPPLPTGTEDDRGSFVAFDIDPGDLTGVRTYVDELSFDPDDVRSTPAVVAAGGSQVRGFDGIPDVRAQTPKAVLADLDGRPADPADVRWHRRIGRQFDAAAEQLQVTDHQVLTSIAGRRRVPGSVRSEAQYWIGEGTRLGRFDAADFTWTANVTRKWDDLDGSAMILSGTYAETARGWFSASIADGAVALHGWSTPAPSGAFDLIPGDRSIAHVSSDEVRTSTTFRTTAVLHGVPVRISRPWNAFTDAAIGVVVDAQREPEVIARDGRRIRFERRDESWVTTVRPIDLVDVVSEIVS
ncbi:hypothetical protein AAEP80_01735 [Curtobacterium sp. L3-7]|uniref:hypothetical protein n=1 Tax=Curtobacterium sp. L3-7 TaxID=3138787 RepID=UPI003B526379